MTVVFDVDQDRVSTQLVKLQGPGGGEREREREREREKEREIRNVQTFN